MCTSVVDGIDIAGLNALAQLVGEVGVGGGVVVAVLVEQLLAHGCQQRVLLVDGQHGPQQFVLVDVGQLAVLAEHGLARQALHVELALLVLTDVVLVVEFQGSQHALDIGHAIGVELLSGLLNDEALEGSEEVVVIAVALAGVGVAHVVDLLLRVLDLADVQGSVEVEQEAMLNVLSGLQVDVIVEVRLPALHVACHCCAEGVEALHVGGIEGSAHGHREVPGRAVLVEVLHGVGLCKVVEGCVDVSL